MNLGKKKFQEKKCLEASENHKINKIQETISKGYAVKVIGYYYIRIVL